MGTTATFDIDDAYEAFIDSIEPGNMWAREEREREAREEEEKPEWVRAAEQAWYEERIAAMQERPYDTEYYLGYYWHHLRRLIPITINDLPF